jgi:hypothetical protein
LKALLSWQSLIANYALRAGNHRKRDKNDHELFVHV